MAGFTSGATLEGQTALITGASRGIGAATARLLARAGVKVALVARDRERLEGVAHEATGAISLPGDVSDEGQCAALVQKAEQHFGRLDIIVNNAGRLGGGLLAEMETGEWLQTLRVDLVAPFLLARAALPGMIARRYGQLISVTSGITALGFALPGVSAYTVSKAGLDQLTRHLAAENARHGVRANSVDPGSVDTDMAAETLRLPFMELWPPGVVEFMKTAPLAPPTQPARLIQWVLSNPALNGQAISITDPEVRRQARLDDPA